MKFNILHGATTKNDFNLDTIAGVVNKYEPDLVAIQEVDFKAIRQKNMVCLLKLQTNANDVANCESDVV